MIIIISYFNWDLSDNFKGPQARNKKLVTGQREAS
jgi:hypothetical protein